MPLVGSQCCPARVYDKTFQSFGDKTILSKSFGVSFSQSNVGTFKQVSTSFGLSKRRISAVFSCFGQSLILPAASIQRSQTQLFNRRRRKRRRRNRRRRRRRRRCHRGGTNKRTTRRDRATQPIEARRLRRTKKRWMAMLTWLYAVYLKNEIKIKHCNRRYKIIINHHWGTLQFHVSSSKSILKDSTIKKCPTCQARLRHVACDRCGDQRPFQRQLLFVQIINPWDKVFLNWPSLRIDF